MASSLARADTLNSDLQIQVDNVDTQDAIDNQTHEPQESLVTVEEEETVVEETESEDLETEETDKPIIEDVEDESVDESKEFDEPEKDLVEEEENAPEDTGTELEPEVSDEVTDEISDKESEVLVQDDLRHSIETTVEPTSATIGDELVYTIIVTNIGDSHLEGIEVTYLIPSEVTVLKVSKDNGKSWVDPRIEDNLIILDTDVKESKTYKIKAYINENATNGQTITNLVKTNLVNKTDGKIISEEASAKVKVRATNIIIKNMITGNFGELSREFEFILKVGKKGHYDDKTFEFNLSHEEEEHIENLPTDATLILMETLVNGYKVTVEVDGYEDSIKEDGSYTLNLTDIKDKKTITVENNYEVDIDTGIFNDSSPYLLILTFVIVVLSSIAIATSYANSYKKRQ